MEVGESNKWFLLLNQVPNINYKTGCFLLQQQQQSGRERYQEQMEDIVK